MLKIFKSERIIWFIVILSGTCSNIVSVVLWMAYSNLGMDSSMGLVIHRLWTHWRFLSRYASHAFYWIDWILYFWPTEPDKQIFDPRVTWLQQSDFMWLGQRSISRSPCKLGYYTIIPVGTALDYPQNWWRICLLGVPFHHSFCSNLGSNCTSRDHAPFQQIWCTRREHLEDRCWKTCRVNRLPSLKSRSSWWVKEKWSFKCFPIWIRKN